MKSTEEYRTGQVIIKQGAVSDGFYVLEKGSVEVFKDDKLLNVLIYPGTVFGEIGDILEAPRTCTITARSQTLVTKYENEDLGNLVEKHPEIAVKIMKTLASRLQRTTQKLSDISSASNFWPEA